VNFLPFSAVVGQSEAKLALILAAVEPRIGGVLLRGEKGSAKTTLARGLAALLPGSAPFVELPVGATEDRVVGTLDLAAALTGGQKRFDPGLLHRADGGVLYVDEINLLPDHLVDVLLDVAASGVNRVEREGISHSHPSRFLLIGSMNPEEGDLRPQLLDRFGLAVDVAAPSEPGERAAALRRRLAFDVEPEAILAEHGAADRALAAQLASCRPAAVPDAVVSAVADLCGAVGAEGLRADLTICRAASALAGWEGRPVVTSEDARRVAPLALAHRARRDPLDPAGGPSSLESQLDEHLPPPSAAGDGSAEQSPARSSSAGSDSAGSGSAGSDSSGSGSSEPRSGESGSAHPDAGEDASAPVVDPPEPPVAPDTPMGLVALPSTGRRGHSGGPVSSGRRAPAPGQERGRMVGARTPEGPVTSVAVGATVRAAAARRASAPSAALVEPVDVRQAVREDRRSNLIVLAVDASASMGSRRRMEAAKGVVMSLLRDAYVRRDLVSLVAFGGDEATVLLKPTGSVEVARARLATLPSGGRTPLAAGLQAALRVALSRPGDGHTPLIVVITDGRATGPGDPLAAAMTAAAEVRRAGVRALVVDVEGEHGALGLGRELAAALGAKHEAVADLDPSAMESAVRRLTGAPAPR
jgi:magnesium chelatase subunit D